MTHSKSTQSNLRITYQSMVRIRAPNLGVIVIGKSKEKLTKQLKKFIK